MARCRHGVRCSTGPGGAGLVGAVGGRGLAGRGREAVESGDRDSARLAPSHPARLTHPLSSAKSRKTASSSAVDDNTSFSITEAVPASAVHRFPCPEEVVIQVAPPFLDALPGLEEGRDALREWYPRPTRRHGQTKSGQNVELVDRTSELRLRAHARRGAAGGTNAGRSDPGHHPWSDSRDEADAGVQARRPHPKG
jgi:hypothetical protein